MGNALVDLVLASFESLAFSNGLDLPSLRPIADLVVIRLEDAGYSPESIELIFGETTPNADDLCHKGE